MNIDDPKLTAYALNELPAAEERAEVENWLAGHAEAREFVSETREMAALLKEKLQPAGTAPRLTDAQRAAILRGNDGAAALPRSGGVPAVEGGSGSTAASGKIRRVRFTVAALTALAACLAFGPLLPWGELMRLRKNERSAIAAAQEPTFNIQMDQEMKSKDFDLRKPMFSREIDQPASPAPLLAMQEEAKKDSLSAIATFSAPWTTPQPATSLPGVDGTKPEGTQLQPFADVVALRGEARIKSNELARSEQTESKPAGAVAPATARAGFITAPYVDGTTRGAAFGGVIAKSSALADRDPYSKALVSANQPPEESRSRDKSELRQDEPSNTAAYDAMTENPFLVAEENPLSTFSIDVDTASYANLRRFLNDGQLPPRGAVRIEEMLNYFSYNYPAPTGDVPFSTNMEVSECPWQPEHRLVRIGLRGRDVPASQRPAGNLVFLIDVSGSMQPADRLPLLKQSLRLLVDQLGPEDKVAIAVYAGSSGLVLPSTSNKDRIRAALDGLESGGSTNGASGIQLAYQIAAENFIQGGTNRVVLATDGDFNVGVTNQSDLVDLIKQKAKTGVFLSVLGFGRDNLKDSTMEKLADQGNGNYAYIDSLNEGRKVLVEQIGGTLCTIAKDVKMQIEFNPALVSAYRLIGYENRMLRKEDFNDDQKDAGEIGANHTVTAFYEIVPVGSLAPVAGQVDELKYLQNSVQMKSAVATLPTGEMLTLKLRYKQPAGDTSSKLEYPLIDQGGRAAQASADFRFAAAVAEAGLLLRQSENKELAAWDSAIELAASATGEDRNGYRREFVELLRKAKALRNREG